MISGALGSSTEPGSSSNTLGAPELVSSSTEHRSLPELGSSFTGLGSPSNDPGGSGLNSGASPLTL
eukprot:15465303-Alexandrium_andersonii.AAC.1